MSENMLTIDQLRALRRPRLRRWYRLRLILIGPGVIAAGLLLAVTFPNPVVRSLAIVLASVGFGVSWIAGQHIGLYLRWKWLLTWSWVSAIVILPVSLLFGLAIRLVLQ